MLTYKNILIAVDGSHEAEWPLTKQWMWQNVMMQN